ncbi:PLP-dependent aminotransferase family protein [Rhizobium sp. 1AS11]|uniref:aminotransferase-like domain-containing protein n=1 Tax=Rhizobium acaciae TaxID=2989736 RepID=UPI00222219D9|nr:PLP-dependent aminotransferase family protein [Rhizobium acaciae]MCW1412999.1 PLP-dependent aminotransferase family protein [Rhizobium acaciae]MCW1745151.1 PLP-dependent aminotransferase family protein [Rhizobium acaciae]
MRKLNIPAGSMPDRCVDKNGLIRLNLNHPPPVPETFDQIFKDVLEELLLSVSPSALVKTHRWTGTEDDRLRGAEFTAGRLGTPPVEGRVVLTHSTQAAIHMILPGIIPEGRTLAVEQMAYPPVRTFAQRYGVPLVDVPIDGDGLEPDAFEGVCQKANPAAIYLVTTYQNPTTVTMSLQRRRQIAEIARRYDVKIIEDDIYSLLSPSPLPPISAIAPEISWYLLGTAKSFAAGLKLAYVVAPTPNEAARVFWPGVRATYWMATPMSAALMSNLIRRGDDLVILTAVKNELRIRHQLLDQILGDCRYATDPGCLHVWLPLPAGTSSQELADAIKSEGVQIAESNSYTTPSFRPSEAIRIGIGNPETLVLLEHALVVLDRNLTSAVRSI